MGKTSAKVFDLKGEEVDKVRLPRIFKTPNRPDVIKRAVVAIQSHRFQPQGRDIMAGKRTTAESRGTGLGIARIPRMKERGQRAAFAPGTVGGRSAHPPVAEKKIKKKIPRKEMRLALRSAISATASKEIVASRGHMVNDVPDFPLVVMDEIQSLKRTKDVEEALMNLGVWPDIFRVKESRKVRAGKGKMRGRKMKQAVGPLLVINKNEGVAEAARNLPGMEVASVENLNAELLAPGTHPGRLTVWTSSAFEKVEKVFGGR
uniref:Large ribosomal subunit protein uL4 n=1 Tax=uncultured miscellaneous Crenarchaeota group TaxID=1368239 RepID=W8SHT8_9ARCH|nr:50S ribosomal protein L4P [uncultured miscellaneous Crenarchaeota group]